MRLHLPQKEMETLDEHFYSIHNGCGWCTGQWQSEAVCTLESSKGNLKAMIFSPQYSERG